MPHKGFFTQGLVVLLDRPITLDRLEATLRGVEVLKRVPETNSWAFGGPSLVLGYRPEVNGLISVDATDRPWPDHMGDPKSDSEVFGAWSMGHFGPFAYPGALQRAREQAWGWKGASRVVLRHKAFVRLRCSYVFGADPKAPLVPPDYEPLPELEFVTGIAGKLLSMPEALCYFNPNGERLLPQDEFASYLGRGKASGPLPLELWANVRVFNLGGSPAWSLMDIVGMGQLDAPDHEACFQTDAYSPHEVENFLYNAALYVFENGRVINDGDTMDGPGGVRWQCATFENGLSDPPREVLRWFPLDRRRKPEGLQGKTKG